jgi:hypothetical protein
VSTCVACGSDRPDICELLGHVYPIREPNYNHVRESADIAALADATRSAGVQLATIEHYRLTDPLFEFVEPRLGE